MRYARFARIAAIVVAVILAIPLVLWLLAAAAGHVVASDGCAWLLGFGGCGF